MGTGEATAFQHEAIWSAQCLARQVPTDTRGLRARDWYCSHGAGGAKVKSDFGGKGYRAPARNV